MRAADAADLPGIHLVDVRKAFGEQRVLDGVTLEVPRGQITVVIGRSGTGKSVLLKHVMGLLQPDSGTVRVGNEDLSTLGPRALRQVRFRFGVVFQHAALFDSMDVFENVAFPLREHGLVRMASGRDRRMREPEIGARVEQLLRSVGLEGAGAKPVDALSGGMRKRVGLARALVRDPEFLLYDEPTTGLDPIMTAQIDNLIRATQDANPGITSLVISHDMQATFRIADTIAMLHEGKVQLCGSPAEFQSSADPIVRQFVEGRVDPP